MSWVRCRVFRQVELALAPVMKYSLHDDMVLISLCLYIIFVCCYVIIVSYILLSVVVLSLCKSTTEGSSGTDVCYESFIDVNIFLVQRKIVPAFGCSQKAFYEYCIFNYFTLRPYLKSCTVKKYLDS